MNNRKDSAFLFDLDGTLIDSVYQHVIAWREALEEVGVNLAVWKIHRRIGMSGGLFVTALRRELGDQLDDETIERLPDLHAEAFMRHYSGVRPLPGATELLAGLTEMGIPWAIATSGAERTAGPRPRAARAARGPADGHARSGPLRQARPGPVPHRGGADRRRHPRQHRRRRQRLGPARRAPGRRTRASASCRAATVARS